MSSSTFKRNEEVFGTRLAVDNLIGVAPEDCRDDVAKVLRTWFNEAAPLRHSRSK